MANLTAGQQQQFTATVTGSSNTAVTWSLSPAGIGSITPDGLYTAPSTVTAEQTITVTATAAADPARTASATIRVRPAFTPIRVNAGAAAPWTDAAGQVWSADTAYLGGAAYAVGAAIANTTSDPLYQSERWHSSTIQYRFAVPNGTYTARLKFAEIYYSTPGSRVFHVVLNGQTVAANFDPLAAAGGPNTAIDQAWTVVVTTGQLAIDLVPVVSHPKISAIEITSGAAANVGVAVTPDSANLTAGQQQRFTATVTGSPNTAVTWSLSPSGAGSIAADGLYTAPPTVMAEQTVTVTATAAADPARTASATIRVRPAFTPIRVNAGAAAPWTDAAGQVWSADTGYVGGAAYAVGAPIANTTSDPLYQSERWHSSTIQYRFAVPNGTYTARLKFAEIYYSTAGSRVFNIVLNGQIVAANFDPLAAAGGPNTAVDRVWTATVTTGQLAIDLVPVVSHPKISAIEITSGPAN
jgi:hypothetical protein